METGDSFPEDEDPRRELRGEDPGGPGRTGWEREPTEDRPTTPTVEKGFRGTPPAL